ncbi:hypothetical protein CDV55_108814 [Aspergillus turcosus]|uniref:F-box domain-containing protein n=1 Tax=Aspergillus turcosus TaxID=1245748 RepID=A0A229Z5A7_9EURO|nr:hypothetical protein CDV55_108814 [Aspergillus turcosus]RLM00783.1 hypothetical protein CFD26_106668 [Aspergillus turcosus]
MTLTDLPPELIHLIADLLEVDDLLAFILTSRHLARLLDPLLQDRALTYRCRLITFRSDLSPFEVAACQGNADTLQKLLAHAQKRGLEIPQRDRDRALYFPACNDDVDLLEFLVKVARADISALIYNGPSKVNRTALHWAVVKGKEAAVQKLIELGADVNAVDERGHSVLHLAVTPESYNEIETSTRIAKLLLENGAMIEARSLSGKTPLHKAVLDSNIQALELLLDYGADIMARDNQGMTALHYAVRWPDFYETIVLLVERGSDVDATNNDGFSVRELALLCCNDDICEYLESHGAA